MTLSPETAWLNRKHEVLINPGGRGSSPDAPACSLIPKTRTSGWLTTRTCECAFYGQCDKMVNRPVWKHSWCTPSPCDPVGGLWGWMDVSRSSVCFFFSFLLFEHHPWFLVCNCWHERRYFDPHTLTTHAAWELFEVGCYYITHIWIPSLRPQWRLWKRFWGNSLRLIISLCSGKTKIVFKGCANSFRTAINVAKSF